MRSRHHVCQSVEGALRNWKTAEWRSLARSNDCSVAEAKEMFWALLREGKRVIPFGEACEGFSYQTGCPGHPEPAEPSIHGVGDQAENRAGSESPTIHDRQEDRQTSDGDERSGSGSPICEDDAT